MQKRVSLTLVVLAITLVAGCSQLRFPGVYRIDIEQGNVVDERMLGELKAGMTAAQVRFVMGPPQMVDPFDPKRWLYNYRLRRGNGEIIDNRVTLWFENGVLARWEGKPLPANARYRSGPAAAATTPEAAPAN